MKYIVAGILLIMWMTVTIILAISVVGWVLFDEDYGWLDFAKELLEVFKT